MVDKVNSKSGAISKKGRSKNDENKPKSAGNLENESNSKKNRKFVNLYSDEGKERETILLSGRHPCNCLASRCV